jgi:hypothetical protein
MRTSFTVAAAAALALGMGSFAFAQSSTTTRPPSGSSATQPMPGASTTTTTPGMRYGANDMGKVREDLMSKGYSDISNLKHEGNHWTADAKENGKSVKVNVDSATGNITKMGG